MLSLISAQFNFFECTRSRRYYVQNFDQTFPLELTTANRTDGIAVTVRKTHCIYVYTLYYVLYLVQTNVRVLLKVYRKHSIKYPSTYFLTKNEQIKCPDLEDTHNRMGFLIPHQLILERCKTNPGEITCSKFFSSGRGSSLLSIQPHQLVVVFCFVPFRT